MPFHTGLNLRHANGVCALAALGATLACGPSEPPIPDLTPSAASALILQRWSQHELNHFKVSLHSDTLIECGVQNDLWKLVEVTDRSGNAWTTQYQLTDNGNKALMAIDLRESGRGHEIMLKGPYRVEITGIADGAQPTSKKVSLRWDIDWDKASAGLKACVPRFELSGKEEALFEYADNAWRFVSYSKYLNPDDQQAPAQPDAPAAPPPEIDQSVLQKIR